MTHRTVIAGIALVLLLAACGRVGPPVHITLLKVLDCIHRSSCCVRHFGIGAIPRNLHEMLTAQFAVLFLEYLCGGFYPQVRKYD